MYCGRALAYCNKGNHDKAIADLREAIRLDPKAAETYWMQSVALMKGDRAKAIEDFARAKRAGP